MANIPGSKKDGRSSDLTFSWLTKKYGATWEQWRSFAEEYIRDTECSAKNAVDTFSGFFERYLMVRAPYAADPLLFFNGYNGHKCSTEDIDEELAKHISSQHTRAKRINTIELFI